MDKKARMRKEQQTCLLDFILSNPEMVNGNIQAPATKSLWCELTESLNKMGVKKSQKEWLETYKLLARKTKAKMRLYKRSFNGTGGGPPPKDKLSDLESKVLSIEGITTVIGLSGAIETAILPNNTQVRDIISSQQKSVIEFITETKSTQDENQYPDNIVIDTGDVTKDILSADVSQESENLIFDTYVNTPVMTSPPPSVPVVSKRVNLSASTRQLRRPTTADPMLEMLQHNAQAQIDAAQIIAHAQTEAAEVLGRYLLQAASTIAEAFMNRP